VEIRVFPTAPFSKGYQATRLPDLDKSLILKLALLVEIVVLTSTAAAISRDYQDAWILEGLEIPFAAFMFTFTVYIFAENNIAWITVFAVLVRSVIVLVPNLKYDWFLGVSIDQHSHYRLVQDIYNEGHVPSPIPGVLYSGTPNMHSFFVIYSSVTNVPILFTFKYLPELSWFVYPLIIYLIMKKSLPTKKHFSALKYAVLLSAIPVKATTSFLVVGTLFGALFAFLFIALFIRLLQTNNRKYLVTVLICSLSLVGTHSYSSILLTTGLLMMYLAYNINHLRCRFKIFQARAPIVLFLIVLNASWLSYVATDLFRGTFVNIIKNYLNTITGVSSLTGFPTTGIISRFFELHFLDKLRIIILYYGGDIALLFLMLIGILILVKKFHSNRSLMFLSFYILSLWLFEIVHLMFTGARAGLFEFNRIFEHTLLLSPIFGAISLHYLQKKFRNSKLVMFIILLLIILAAVELYGYQPLVPSARVIGLPYDEPIVYVTDVNSVYQRRMIDFAERYSGDETHIASDTVTLNQVIGLTSSDFSSKSLLWYYPFSRLLNQSIITMEYDYFLIHVPGKSGPFQDKVETHTRSLILEAVHNSNIVYTNGESYVLAKPFMSSNP